jgi:hypothetical protein
MMRAMLCGAMMVSGLAAAGAQPADTIRLELGSKELDASYFQPHAARVRVYVTTDGRERIRSEWVNVLRVGDSAGRRVHHWVTTGTQNPATGTDTVHWELRQTYDAKTLAPYGIVRTASSGPTFTFRIDGTQVTGWRRAGADAPQRDTAWTIDRPGYMARASDLVPMAARFKPGKVMVAPIWDINMRASEMRVFTVLGQVDVDVEGTKVTAWKVEERRQADRALLATWWLLDKSPYMVYGEVPLPDGTVQRMTEVEVPLPPLPKP